MATRVLMPRLTYEMREGVILRWLKEEGEEVREGEPLFEVETDKAIVTVEAPASGIVCGIRAQAGQTVPIGEVVAFIAAPGEEVPDLGPTSVEVVAKEPEMAPLSPEITHGRAEARRILATPLARRTARQHGIDLSTIEGSGSGGRIVEEDVLREVERRRATGLAAVEPPHKLIDLSRLRKATGERLAESQRSVPHFVLEVNADMRAADRFREQHKELNGQEVSYTSIIVKAVAMALQEYPEINTAFGDGGIKIFDEVNIGVAMAVTEGLIVPVIHRANEKSVPEIDESLTALRERAKERTFRSEDLAGGTFTISNLGMYGVDAFQAIINPPEAAILAVGRIRDMPVGIDGEIVLCPTMNMKLSIDHRVLDGAMAAPFLVRVKELLEECQFDS